MALSSMDKYSLSEFLHGTKNFFDVCELSVLDTKYSMLVWTFKIYTCSWWFEIQYTTYNCTPRIGRVKKTVWLECAEKNQAPGFPFHHLQRSRHWRWATRSSTRSSARSSKSTSPSCQIIFREADSDSQDEQQDHLHLDRRGANAGDLLPSPDYPEVFKPSETILLRMFS